MFPTIHQYQEGLQTPHTTLRTLGGATFATSSEGLLQIGRTTHFAEVRGAVGRQPLLLLCPLSPTAHRSAETVAQRLKYRHEEFLLPWRMLRNEFTYLDARGIPHICDLVLQELPQGGGLLTGAAATYDRDRLLDAIRQLEEAMHAAGITHNNLKPSNLWLTPDGKLFPLRYVHMRFDGGDDTAGFDALRRFATECCSVAQMMRDTSTEYHAPRPDFSNHLWVGHMFEQMICVEDAEGYGYVDTQNRTVIAPQYAWANDFHEGRAEVTARDGRMGLIDKRGDYIIEPRYEIVEFDDTTGRTMVRHDGRWALFDYEGRQLTEFGAVEP